MASSSVWAMLALLFVFKMLIQLTQICEGFDDGEKMSTKNGDKASTSGDFWKTILSDDQPMGLGFDGRESMGRAFEDNFGTTEWAECATPIDQWQWPWQQQHKTIDSTNQQDQHDNQYFGQLSDQSLFGHLGNQRQFDHLGDQRHFGNLADQRLGLLDSQRQFDHLGDQRHFGNLADQRLGLFDSQRQFDHLGGQRHFGNLGNFGDVKAAVSQDKGVIHPPSNIEHNNTIPIRIIPTPEEMQEAAGPSNMIPMGPPLAPMTPQAEAHHYHRQQHMMPPTGTYQNTVLPSAHRQNTVLPSANRQRTSLGHSPTVQTNGKHKSFTVFTPGITVPAEREHTVAKRPIENEKDEKANDQRGKGRQKVSKTGDKEQHKEEKKEKRMTDLNRQKDTKAKKIKSLCVIFAQILLTLNENVEIFPIQPLLALLKKGTKKEDLKIVGQFEQLAKTLRQMDTSKVGQRLNQKMVENLIINEKMMHFIRQIDTEVAILFGKELKNHQNDQLFLEIIQQKIEFADKKIESRAKLLFFFLRLFRKMVGLIGAPYQGIDQPNTEKAQRSEREALLILIGMTRKETMTYFEHFLDVNAFDERKKMSRALASLDGFDFFRESVELAHFAVSHSLDPLLIGQNVFGLKFACLLVLLEDISAKNFACLLVANAANSANGTLLMAQIEKNAKNQTERVTNTFLHLFYGVIRQNGGSQNEDELIRNAKKYGQIYAEIHKYMKKIDENELIVEIIDKNELIKKAFDKLRIFLTKSVAQLDQLIKQWDNLVQRENGRVKQAKEVISREFKSDFMQNHCQDFVRERDRK